MLITGRKILNSIRKKKESIKIHRLRPTFINKNNYTENERKKDWKDIYTNGNGVISGWLVKIISLISNRISAKTSLSEKNIKI